MPQINESRTSNLSYPINDIYISKSYDLAIAKMALKIQAEESLKFDNSFVNCCAFECTKVNKTIIMWNSTSKCLSSAIGKFIAESGPT